MANNATKRNSVMKPEIVRDFLNVPGILGVALLDGKTPLYFCRIDPRLNLQQAPLLEQGLLQIMATIPIAFASFELLFQSYRVHICRPGGSLTALIVTEPQLKLAQYAPALQRFCQGLQGDEQAIAGFRGTVEKLMTHGLLKAGQTAPDAALLRSATPQPQAATQPPPQLPTTAPTTAPSTPSTSVCIKDLLVAFNHLAQIAGQYLGQSIVANHLLRSRPESAWLQQFMIDRKATLEFSGETHQLHQSLTDEELHDMRRWAQAFVAKCSLVLRDFLRLVEQQGWTASEKSLLLG